MSAPALTVPDVLPIARAYVQKPENSAGGSLHILLDDFNELDGHVDFCIQWAKDHHDVEGLALALLLRQMTRTQRLKIAHQCWEG